jgi:hypothetical protein
MTMRIVISWLPFLLLLSVWISFMFWFRLSPASANRRLWFGQVLYHLERIEQLLAEIATKLGRDDR